MPQYLYLHGFASGPQSHKAQVFKRHFQQLGIPLVIPDLNQGDFSSLTLSRQIQQVSQLVQANPDSTVLIGSSLGGLTAAWVVQQPQVQGRVTQLVLLAPAFQFLAQWLARLGAAQLEAWRTQGTMAVYHYAYQQSLPLHYGFITDAQGYDDAALTAPIPTLILHGSHDQVIAIEASRTYAATRPWVTLVALPSDHALTDVEQDLWHHTQQFLAQQFLGCSG